MKKTISVCILAASLCITSSCSLITVPVKTVGKVATKTVYVAGKTTVKVAGKVAGAGIKAVTPNRAQSEIPME